MGASESAHLSELAELRDRVVQLQSKETHSPQELAELDMLRGRVLDFQVPTLHLHLCLPVQQIHDAYPHVLKDLCLPACILFSQPSKLGEQTAKVLQVHATFDDAGVSKDSNAR